MSDYDFYYVQDCRWCQYGREANYLRPKRGYSTNTETCSKRCFRKIAKQYLALIEKYPELKLKRERGGVEDPRPGLV